MLKTTINNTARNASNLLSVILNNELYPVFDLDGVLLDASHRCKFDNDGHLDLQHYRANTTALQVALDKNLPLIQAVRSLNALGESYSVCTARIACLHTRRLLSERQINPSQLMHRGNAECKDDDLKRGLLSGLTVPENKTPVLIDDSKANCLVAQSLGFEFIHVDFDLTANSVKVDSLDIRPLLA